MVNRLRKLPRWALVSSTISAAGVFIFVCAAILAFIGGQGGSEVFFDLLLAGAFVVLTMAFALKGNPQIFRSGNSPHKRKGPLFF